MLSGTRISPLSPHFGAVLTGCDLRVADPTDAETLRGLLYANKVLLLRNVSLSTSEYLAFARLMGEPVPFVDEEYRHPEHPEIFVVSNTTRDSKRFGMDRVGYYWHSDSSFLEEPLPLTMLYSQAVPEKGGETAFIDMSHVYETLSEPLRQRADGALARHEGKWRYLLTAADVGLSVQEILERDEREVPSRIHPMVVSHPRTGRAALYLSEGITRRIAGCSQEESESLLKELWTQVDGDGARYVHRWTEGEILLWDNRSVIHRASPAAEGQTRLMFRIGLNDGPFFGTLGGDDA